MSARSVCEALASIPPDVLANAVALRKRTQFESPDPELTETMLRRTDEARADSRLSEDEADMIRRQLSRANPHIVLEQWWKALTPLHRLAGVR